MKVRYYTTSYSPGWQLKKKDTIKNIDEDMEKLEPLTFSQWEGKMVKSLRDNNEVS